MNREQYLEYLNSPYWKRRRRGILIARGYRCEKCGLDCSIPERKSYINVHHLNYDDLGNEFTRDLIALCRNCHRDAHERNSSLLGCLL